MSLPRADTSIKEEAEMQYVIMIGMVVGLAAADFITGIIKGYVTRKLSSNIMRKGGLNKIAEIVIMTAVCGLEIGMDALGKYYGEKPAEFAALTGTVTAIAVFSYIVLMELLSMLENYTVINPKAVWAKKIVKRLKIHNNEEDEK